MKGKRQNSETSVHIENQAGFFNAPALLVLLSQQNHMHDTGLIIIPEPDCFERFIRNRSNSLSDIFQITRPSKHILMECQHGSVQCAVPRAAGCSIVASDSLHVDESSLAASETVRSRFCARSSFRGVAEVLV